MKRYFTLEYWQEEGWYVGKLKEVPGVFSQGETLEELKTNIAEAYQLMLESSEMDTEHPKSQTIELSLEF
ncbi:MAG: type II toxin-antitoxin system HicB family antitoxin [Chitinispirillaceae bacterium]